MATSILPTYGRADLRFVRGEGVWLFTDDGQSYLDFGAGIAVNSLGHAHPKLKAALNAQADLLWHTSNLYHIPKQEELAERLTQNSFADKVFFTNSGTESMECAVKMARRYFYEKGHPKKNRIITFEGCFHGRTLGMISAAKSDKLTKGFGPLLDGFDQVPLNDLDALENAITDETAAIMMEPIVGEGGIIPLSAKLLTGLRQICDKHDLLLIFDEIQCGVGRTGKLFAHEFSSITPDIMGIAKGIGGGFPLGACLATDEAASGMIAGSHGSTFGGNPLACAVGIAVLDEVLSDGFFDHVSCISGKFRQSLEALVASYPEIFEEVRGEGLMLALKCKIPNSEFLNASYDHKLLLVPGGDNVVRLLPPLNITFDEVEETIIRLTKAAEQAEQIEKDNE